MSFVTEIIDNTKKAKASRLSFGEAIAELGEKYPKLMVLDADLSKSTRTDLFAAKFPDRFMNMGIAEANMIGVASGLAFSGFVPFAASFGCFLTGRFDQIRMSVSFSRANVRLVGTHSGVSIGEDGHSQMALEDLALMRSLPNMAVIQPADDEDTKRAIEWSLNYEGPVYFRMTRQNLPALKVAARATEKFEVGKWELLNTLKDSSLVMLASGGLVANSIEAADSLAKTIGGDVTLVNANWIRPIDEMLLKKILMSKPKAIVTLEDHYTIGGLGSAVAEYLSSQGAAVRLLRIGVEGFGQSGSPEANQDAYGLSSGKIAARIEQYLRAIEKV